MTSHHLDFGSADFDLNEPAALIAAIPAILGFTPEDSLVLVTVDRGQIGAVLRVDLDNELSDNLGELVSAAAAARPDAVIAVIVDAAGARCPMCIEGHQRLAAALATEVGGRDIPLVAAHLVDRVAAGGQWHCVDGCGARGRVNDPECSPVAVAAVLDGRRLYGRRSDLQAVIAVDDGPRSQRVAEAVAALQAGEPEAAAADTTSRARRAVQDTLAATARIAAGAELTDAEIAVVGFGMADLRVRDTLYGLAVGAAADAAEALWAALARVLPEQWRVEALVQLAFSAYARGDGPLAGVSLEAALRIDPVHRMAGMLDTALQAGMRPEQIRDLAVTAYRLADELGVVLPAREEVGRRAG
ncbi:MAG: DUF4192 domain-containing protein [Mycobacterium sp.]